MSEHQTQSPVPQLFNKRFLPYYVGGAACLLLICGAVFYWIITGKTRRPESSPTVIAAATSTEPTATLIPRHLDGVLVEPGQEAFMPRAVMVDNMVDARPWSGVDQASLVIEAPAEGGITRFLTIFDGGTTTTKIGPVRSARPYYLDWAQGWDAAYFHVGGSPDAIDRLKQMGPSFANIDEMARGSAFWRATDRLAPHNAYTSGDMMMTTLDRMGFASTTVGSVWHFQDGAASSSRGGVTSISVPYGGSYNVVWKFDKDRGVYVRNSGGKVQKTLEGNSIEVQNLVVIKTDSQVLDEKGRLKIRTTGSGQAIIYRDGNKYPVIWRRSSGEAMRFEGTDGSEFLFTRGKTWIEVTTDDRIFAGI